jgi:hypothetical protein
MSTRWLFLAVIFTAAILPWAWDEARDAISRSVHSGCCGGCMADLDWEET